MAHFVDDGRPLVEFGAVTEIACSGLARVELFDPGAGCFVFYRNALGPNGEPERQVCGRLFMPLASCAEAIDLTSRGLLEARALSVSLRRFVA
jgi:hypothetical protein